jgi:hypothetical protein
MDAPAPPSGGLGALDLWLARKAEVMALQS